MLVMAIVALPFAASGEENAGASQTRGVDDVPFRTAKARLLLQENWRVAPAAFTVFQEKESGIPEATEPCGPRKFDIEGVTWTTLPKTVNVTERA